ncbi:MAG: hypothetical protein IKP88_03350 [Lachnospiraceae bacterium]|nr:hypothetical protein [Lachnospiraceae bacterium]
MKDYREFAWQMERIIHKYTVTILFGIETYEAYLKWCNKARKVLA